MVYQVKSIRALVVQADGQCIFLPTLVHRYTDAGGHDIPITSAAFTVNGSHSEYTGLVRDLIVNPIWRGYTVHIVHPAPSVLWAGEAIVYKHCARGKAFVNMRKEDRRCALKIVRRAMRAVNLTIPPSARG